MQTRSDHVQAYRDSADRLSTALLAGDAFSGRAPLRRSTTGALFGTAVAVLICVGAFVLGLISPGGNTDWKLPGSIIVEKETGNRFLLIDGTLRPTLNTASAMLATKGGTFRTVSRNSLEGVPRGAPVGIPGAPDTLPQKGLPGVWSQCAVPGGPAPQLVTALGDAVPSVPTGDARVVVAAPDGVHVIRRDLASRVEGTGVLSALGLADVVPVPVSASWLDALAKGPALAPPVVPGAGEPGPPIAGPTQVGQVFTVTVGGATQASVLRRDGLAPVSPTTAALLAARPGAPAERAIGPADVAAVPVSPDRSGLTAVPDLVGAPTVRPDGRAICVGRTSGADGTLSPGTLRETVAPVAPRPAALLAPGTGMVASPLPVPGPGQKAAPQFLIDDQGVRFQVSSDALQSLAPAAPAVWLPADVLAAIPPGPVLLTGSYALTGALPPQGGAG